MFCSNCGKEIDNSAIICPYCGCETPNYKKDKEMMEKMSIPVSDSGSFGWAVLGFLIPIVGLVLWLVWHDTKPRTAKKAGVGAIVGCIFNFLCIVFFYVCVFLSVSMM